MASPTSSEPDNNPDDTYLWLELADGSLLRVWS
jgi:hypothetical protein